MVIYSKQDHEPAYSVKGPDHPSDCLLCLITFRFIVYSVYVGYSLHIKNLIFFFLLRLRQYVRNEAQHTLTDAIQLYFILRN
jgi:hypothetical protein